MARNVGWPLELKVAPDSSQEGIYMLDFITFWGLHDSSVGKESACNAGEPGLIPGSGRSPGEGNGYPLQYSGLENSMDRGAWQATVHGVSKSLTQLSNFHFNYK